MLPSVIMCIIGGGFALACIGEVLCSIFDPR